MSLETSLLERRELCLGIPSGSKELKLLRESSGERFADLEARRMESQEDKMMGTVDDVEDGDEGYVQT